MFYRYAFFFIGIILFQISFALPPPRTTYTSVAAGAWTTGGNWSVGSAPATNQTDGSDDIVVTHHITLTGELSIKSGTTLTIKGCDTLTVNGDVTFSNGCVLEIEPCAVMIINGDVDNNNNSDEVEVNGTIVINGNYDGGNGSSLFGIGAMDITGYVATDGTGDVFGDTDDCLSGCSSSAISVLPISLISFKANYNGGDVDLFWQTASEINNDYFVVERSKDGVEWHEILIISGAGNSSMLIDYADKDVHPLQGVSYYRLKQVDYDGNETTFNVVPVQNLDDGKPSFNIFPNPTTQDNINLAFKGFQNQEVLVVLRDIQGKEYYSKVMIISDNSEIVAASVDKDFPKGIYLVTAASENIFYSQQIVIQ